MTLWNSVRAALTSNEELIKKLDASEARRMELARENMTLQAELSTARTKIAEYDFAIDQLWRDCEGHNWCVINLPRFFLTVGRKIKPLVLPPLDERLEGCKLFWRQFDEMPERYPDFKKVFEADSLVQLPKTEPKVEVAANESDHDSW